LVGKEKCIGQNLMHSWKRGSSAGKISLYLADETFIHKRKYSRQKQFEVGKSSEAKKAKTAEEKMPALNGAV
jgi:hypothetical protein